MIPVSGNFHSCWCNGHWCDCCCSCGCSHADVEFHVAWNVDQLHLEKVKEFSSLYQVGVKASAV